MGRGVRKVLGLRKELTVLGSGSQPRMTCHAARSSGKVSFPHFTHAETEAQRGQVTGLEVRSRVCGRALMKASGERLCPLVVKCSGWAESVQGGHSHPPPSMGVLPFGGCCLG